MIEAALFMGIFSLRIVVALLLHVRLLLAYPPAQLVLVSAYNEAIGNEFATFLTNLKWFHTKFAGRAGFLDRSCNFTRL